MLKNCTSLMLSCLLLGALSLRAASAEPAAGKDSPTPGQIKQKLTRLGTGEKARVTVKLKSGTKLKGYVDQLGEDSFTLKAEKPETTTTVAFADVEQLKGHNLSTGAKIAIGAGIGVAVFVVVGLAIAAAAGGLLSGL